MVMVTLTLAGVWYGWLRLWAGSIWPVSLSHSAFNHLMEGVAWGGDSDFAGGDDARDHRDRRSDHDHHGAGCWLPADPQSCRLRQGRAKIPVGDHRFTHRCTNGRYGGHPLDQLPGDPFAYLEHRDGYSNKPEFWPRRAYPLLSSMPTPLLSASCSQPLVRTPECLLIPCSGR
jgi:hypothetical protein